MLEKIKNIYEIYGFRIDNEDEDHIAFVYEQGLFFGAHIFPKGHLTDKHNKLRGNYSKISYACEIIKQNSFDDIHVKLFNSLFKKDVLLALNLKKYKDFCDAQYKSLGFNYKYVNVPCYFDDEQKVESKNMIETVTEELDKPGSSLIIIEAAAGFGKTCSAFEILNILSDTKKKPALFTQLSKNRKAQIFKYVLLDIIDSELRGTNSDVVKYEIENGNLPLIIDGFDELISGNSGNPGDSNEEFNEVFASVSGMLDSIGTILNNNGKVILTTRKTAIYSGDEFHDWIAKHDNKFRVVRIQISQPNYKEWLDPPKLDYIQKTNKSLFGIINPVLLSSLRTMSYEDFTKTVGDNAKIINFYFLNMANREKDRQNLTLSSEEQLDIFKKLAYSFLQYSIYSESKSFVSDLIKDSSSHIVEASLKRYKNDDKPELNDLYNTLSGHAYLDRKNNKDLVGFINDFVFGILCGYVLIDENSICVDGDKPIEEDLFTNVIVEAFRSHSEDYKNKLLNLVLENKKYLSQKSLVVSELVLGGVVNNIYSELLIEDKNLVKSKVDDCMLNSVVFKDCIFVSCEFNFTGRHIVGFSSCKFFDCKIETGSELTNQWVNDCVFYDSNDLENFFNNREVVGLISPEVCLTDNEKYAHAILLKMWPTGRRFAFKNRPFEALTAGVPKEQIDFYQRALDYLIDEKLIIEIRKTVYCINYSKIPTVQYYRNLGL